PLASIDPHVHVILARGEPQRQGPNSVTGIRQPGRHPFRKISSDFDGSGGWSCRRQSDVPADTVPNETFDAGRVTNGGRNGGRCGRHRRRSPSSSKTNAGRREFAARKALRRINRITASTQNRG